jgi:VWFA-related protein
MSRSRLVGSLMVAGVCLAAGLGPVPTTSAQAPAPPPAPQGPTFRTDASYVLTDVFVTADGKPVTDLTEADFEVREDGVVQTIRSFEAITTARQPSVAPSRRDPSTVAESNAMIGDPRRRVFVVFLDTYHVDRGSAVYVRKALQRFFETSFGPDDLVAYMTPHMSGRDLSFSSSPDALIRYFDDNPFWGVADELAGNEIEPNERDMRACFGDTQEQREAYLGLRSRLREQKSLEALLGLVSHLDGLREARKAVIAVTLGWRLFTENPTRMTDNASKGRPLGVQPLGVGPDGVLGMPDRGRAPGIDRPKCDLVRLQGSLADSRVMFQDLIGAANRSSTTFYTVDAGGLRSEARPFAPNATQSFAEMRNRERVPYSTTLDSLKTLAGATNGLAIADTNNFASGLQRIADDVKAYYLVGYTSTNSRPDGKYRKIKVTVKRPGVQVRARDGYLARRIDDGSPTTSTGAAAASPAASAEAAALSAALGRLEPARAGVPLVVSASAGTLAGGSARAIRVVAELDPAIAATPEWIDGGEAQASVRNAAGETVTTGKGVLAKGARTVEIELPVVDAMHGDVKVQVRVSGQGPLARYTDTTSVGLDAFPTGWGAPRLSRRGPSTGIAWVATADPRFRRQERLRVSVGVPTDAGPVAGTLLDRQGRPMTVPVKVDQPEPGALVAELALAPLAAGDYVVALGTGPKRLLVPLRVVP